MVRRARILTLGMITDMDIYHQMGTSNIINILLRFLKFLKQHY